VRLPSELVDTVTEARAIKFCAYDEVRREAQRRIEAAAEARAAAESAWEAFGAFAGATVVFAGVLLWRRRRSRRDHLPRY
jgi:hypothetical protein